MTYDAIVVGGGHNGLACAIKLARAGWSTLVLERNSRPGGAVTSDELTQPGLIHDTFATNLNLFARSAFYADFGDDLRRHGFEFARSDRPYANAFGGGRTLRVYQDPGRTRTLLEQHHPGDARGWDELHSWFPTLGALGQLHGMPLPSTAALGTTARAVRDLGRERSLELAELLAASTRDLGDLYLKTDEARALLACWSMHLDYAPDVPGCAIFSILEAFGGMYAGMSIARGGARNLGRAMAAMLDEAGGELRTDCEVDRVLLANGRAVGVQLTSGDQVHAKQAVIANLTPTGLFGRLLRHEQLDDATTRTVGRYRFGPGTMMIHLAMSDAIPWEAGEDLDQFAYVHIGPHVADLARTYVEARNGQLPGSPMLVVGQTSAVDPSRTPEGRHVIWIQVRVVPSMISGDAGDTIRAQTWDAAAPAFADRVLDKLSEYAPGLESRILARCVLTPLDLERTNPNLVGGDSGAGTHHPRQYYMLRPRPNWTRYRTPIPALWMVGASTWPGAGVNAMSGYLAADELLAHRHAGRRLSAMALRLGSRVAARL